MVATSSDANGAFVFTPPPSVAGLALRLLSAFRLLGELAKTLSFEMVARTFIATRRPTHPGAVRTRPEESERRENPPRGTAALVQDAESIIAAIGGGGSDPRLWRRRVRAV